MSQGQHHGYGYHYSPDPTAITAHERVELEERDSEEQWTRPPIATQEEASEEDDEGHGDSSWRTEAAAVAELVLARPPKAHWRIGPDLEIERLARPLLRLAAKDPPLLEVEECRRAVLTVYVREQKAFITSGDKAALKKLQPQRTEYDQLFGAFGNNILNKIKANRPSHYLHGQFLYLPSGDLCCAEILTGAQTQEDRNWTVLQAILRSEEREPTGARLTHKWLAERMSQELFGKITPRQVQLLLQGHGVETDSRRRSK